MKTSKPQDFYTIRNDIRRKRKQKREPFVCRELYINRSIQIRNNHRIEDNSFPKF